MDINIEFDELQNKYLASRSDEDLSNLYLLIKGYIRGFLIRYVKSKGLFLSDLEDITEDCTLFIIEQYLRKPEWKVERFTGYYQNAILKVLHNEEREHWDGLKKNVNEKEVTEENLQIFETDIERELSEKEKAEKAQIDNSDNVQCLRHKWVQGELFNGIENK